VALTIEDVRHVARLARLQLNDDELNRMYTQINRLVEHFSALDELNTEGVEPTSHSIPIINVFREDVARPGLPPENFLKEAPQAEDGLFVVPRIVEDES
jgi:aspartyl-tRNA(Asn)/glutamyl-tRNA(Gln) amidotransferase subunit C